jgi:hypothetical protein
MTSYFWREESGDILNASGNFESSASTNSATSAILFDKPTPDSDGNNCDFSIKVASNILRNDERNKIFLYHNFDFGNRFG